MGLIPYLIQGFKEQQKMIEEQQKTINILNTEKVSTTKLLKQIKQHKTDEIDTIRSNYNSLLDRLETLEAKKFNI